MGKLWVDYAYYLGDEDDGVYYAVESVFKGPVEYWYVTAMVDCDTGGFCGELLLDNDGPYFTEVEALEAGYHAARDWCYFNEVWFDDEPDHTMLALPDDVQGAFDELKEDFDETNRD